MNRLASRFQPLASRIQSLVRSKITFLTKHETNMKNVILLFTFFMFVATTSDAQFAVTLTLTDENSTLTNVGFKGAYGGWVTEQGYDDGTNGDVTAGDYTHTVVVMAAQGTYEWGAVDLDDMEAWLINGPNRVFTVDGVGNVTGETSYTIPLMGAPTDVILTIDDSANQSLTGVSFKGSYNGWTSQPGNDSGTDGDATAGDGIWSLTVSATGNASYEWGAENTGCTDAAWLISGPNRIFSVAPDGTVTGETSYTIPAAGTAYPVTFRVDMSNEIVSSTGVFVSGDFQECAWNKQEIQMSETLPGIYEATTMVRPGDYQYKFFNGDCGDNGCQETADFETLGCGGSNGIGGWNRTVDFIGLNGATTQPVYVYDACMITTVGTDDLNILASFQVSPNPFKGMTRIEFNHEAGLYELSISNMMGQIVKEIRNIDNGQVLLNASGLTAGVYFAKLSNAQGEYAVEKIVVY